MPETLDRPPEWQLKAKRKASRWAQIFGLIGAGLAVVAAILIKLYGTTPVVLDPFAFPANLVFFLSDWRGEMGPAVLLAVAVNSAAWAGAGWLAGYGTSR